MPEHSTAELNIISGMVANSQAKGLYKHVRQEDLIVFIE